MGLFHKKKGDRFLGIPSLPELPEPKNSEGFFLSREDLPNVPGELPKIETSSLPSIPYSETRNKFNQDIIKNAIKNQPKDIEEDFPRVVEIEPSFKKNVSKDMVKPEQPIYIRLDKFETTLQSFDEIRSKIEEIERLLKKIQEVKQKEEQELNAWEREIQMIKSRIDFIDRTIFNKLD